MPLAGTLKSSVISLIVHKVSANWAVAPTIGVAAVSNILLAMNRPETAIENSQPLELSSTWLEPIAFSRLAI